MQKRKGECKAFRGIAYGAEKMLEPFAVICAEGGKAGYEYERV